LFDAVNRFPDVEYLVRGHLRLQEGVNEPVLFHERQSAARQERVDDTASSKDCDAGTLNALLSAMEGFDFQADAIGEWAGRLADVQRACSRLFARYLKACLIATKHRSPKAPGGQVQVHPAVKLLTGEIDITASKAADMIKRLLGPLQGDLQGDLYDAYETALRLRPKSLSAASRKGSGKP
jgi:hypothetical protein